jgi:hypothetical protein
MLIDGCDADHDQVKPNDANAEVLPGIERLPAHHPSRLVG